ncbi:MAG: SGNH/GDSL hydrolase family protein [Armatimonadetes bacterium]|nr:SGNH/GDSL hydrolase family protein [Armatimonadota bacterium]
MFVYSRFKSLVISVVMVLGLAASVGAVTTYYCDNPNIKLAPYVWKVTGSGASARAEATMPGAYFKTKLIGTTTVGLVIDGAANNGCPASSMPVIEYSLDDGPFTQKQLTQTGAVYTLAIAPRGFDYTVSHKLEVHFRASDATQNRWTASTAHLRFVGIALDSGGTLLSYTLRSKKAICFGDSITEGVGIDALFTSWQILGPNNARASWFPIVCCAMDCEYGLLGSSGLGMVNQTNLPPLPSMWDHYDANTSRLQNGLLLPEPDYVFCCVGANDPVGVDITSAYIGWISSVRGACPNTRVFCVIPPSGVHRGEIQAAVRTFNQAGDAGVYLIDTPYLNTAVRANTDAVVLFNEDFSGPGDASPNPDPDWTTQATGPDPWNQAMNWQVVNNNGNNAYKCLDASYSSGGVRGEATINGLDLADFRMEADLINASNESWLLGHAYLSADGNFLNFTGLIVDEFMSDGCGGIGFMRFGDVSQSWTIEGYTAPTWNGTSWVIPATNPQAVWTSPMGVAGAFPHGNNKIHVTLNVAGNTWTASALAYDGSGNLAATARTGFTWDEGGATHGLVGIQSCNSSVMFDNVTLSGVSTQMTYDGVHLSMYGQAIFAALVAAQAQDSLSSSPRLSLPVVKSTSDQTGVAIGGYVISAAFPDFFYVESDNRSSGLRVDKAAHGLAVGLRVDASGKIATNADGERYIAADTVTLAGSGSIVPLLMNNRSFGGSALGLQEGVWDWLSLDNGLPAAGLDNIGLLVRVCGRVGQIDPTGAYFYVDDGSALRDGTKTGDADNIGVRVAFDGTPYQSQPTLSITGISSCFKGADGKLHRLLRVRKLAEVPQSTGQNFFASRFWAGRVQFGVVSYARARWS